MSHSGPDRKMIIVVGGDELSTALKLNFPPDQYEMYQARSSEEVRLLCSIRTLRLVVLAIEAKNVLLAQSIKSITAERVKILGILPETDELPRSSPGFDRVVPAAEVPAVVRACRELLDERRQEVRVTIRFPVILKEMGEGIVQNVSQRSLLVHTMMPLDPTDVGKDIQITVGWGDKPPSFLARVLRIEPALLGQKAVVLEVPSSQREALDFLGGLVQRILDLHHYLASGSPIAAPDEEVPDLEELVRLRQDPSHREPAPIRLTVAKFAPREDTPVVTDLAPEIEPDTDGGLFPPEDSSGLRTLFNHGEMPQAPADTPRVVGPYLRPLLLLMLLCAVAVVVVLLIYHSDQTDSPVLGIPSLGSPSSPAAAPPSTQPSAPIAAPATAAAPDSRPDQAAVTPPDASAATSAPDLRRSAPAPDSRPPMIPDARVARKPDARLSRGPDAGPAKTPASADPAASAAPTSRKELLLRAKRALRNGQPAEAATHLEQAMRIKDDLELQRLWVKANEELGNLDRVASGYRRMAEMEPDVAWFQDMLGRTLLEKGDAQGACEAFKEAVRINPSWAIAKRHLKENCK